VELFNKRNFTCDCGTTRLPSTSPCTLRLDPKTNSKGGVHSETPDPNNKYNQNFRNRFCGCECDYDPEKQKGTMFQCLGLGTSETNGCGEDWWHPGCVVGLGPDWFETKNPGWISNKAKTGKALETIAEVTESSTDDSNVDAMEGQANGADKPAESAQSHDDDEDPPLPPGFPAEDDFEGFICYKCVDANPWIKRYAGGPGFLGPVFRRSLAPSPEADIAEKTTELASSDLPNAKKRKSEDEELDSSGPAKRVKDDTAISTDASTAESRQESDSVKSSADAGKPCKAKALPPAPVGQFSLFFKSDFRDHLCRCADCFSNLARHPQLLEEEETYEPPLSESGDEAGGSTVGSGSIYDRGESALKNIDRVRAIEGVMAYNHLKDKLKPFFQQFAESGQAISAEDIKAHFAKLRGDDQAIKEAAQGVKSADNRREQSGH
jgi:E3 ubiquitin-protein ligase UBR7